MTGTPLCACGQPSPDAVLCRACTRDLAAKLTAVAGIAADLEDAVGRQLTRGGGVKGGGDEQPLPYDARAAGVRDALRNCLSGWVRVIADHVPVIFGPVCRKCAHRQCRRILYSRYPADAVPDMAWWLHGHRDAVRQHEAAAAMLHDVRRHLAAAMAAVDQRGPRLYGGPCPGCGADLLGRPGAPVMTCPCGQVTDVAERWAAMRGVMLDMLGSAQWCVTAAAALGAPVNENTVYSWVHREQLVSRGERLSESGRAVVAVYRLGDVLELAGRAAKVRG